MANTEIPVIVYDTMTAGIEDLDDSMTTNFFVGRDGKIRRMLGGSADRAHLPAKAKIVVHHGADEHIRVDPRMHTHREAIVEMLKAKGVEGVSWKR